MKAIIFGATGMIGRSVLRECLLDPGIAAVLTVGRSPTGLRHDKLKEIVHADLQDLAAIEGDLSGYDACFFCLGTSAAGMSEQEYRRATYDLTLTVARTLAGLNAAMTFVYVSGAGTDSTEKGSVMWARVKGETENALLRLPFKAAYMFRPLYIQPLHGIVSKTRLYRALYIAVGFLYPLWKALFPQYVTTTDVLGRAMVNAAKRGAPASVIESRDIGDLGRL